MVSSVFVCSRSEELGEARRALFDAIVDHGAIPEVFEHAAALDGDDAVVALRARKQVDESIARADNLVGIFHQSLGAPVPALAGLTALEYQFLRFMIQRRLQQSEDFSAGGTDAVTEELDLIMPDTECAAGPATHALRNEKRVIEEQLALLAALPADHRMLREKALPALEAMDRDSFYEGRPYFEIFEEDVLLCRHDVEHAHPTDRRLTEFLRRKPVTPFSTQSEVVGEGGQLPLPADAWLYEICRDWLVESVQALDVDYATDRTHAISTRFLSLPEILDQFAHCHLTVANVLVGEEVAVVTSQTPRVKGREVVGSAHYERLESALDGHLLIIEDLEGTVQLRSSVDFVLDLRIANIPGMAYRITSILDRLEVDVCTIEPLVEGTLRRRARRQIGVALRQYPADPEAMQRRVAQQLRSTVGVQSCSIRSPEEAERPEQAGAPIHLGECLVDLGVLSMRDVWDVLERRMEDELFGDAAQRLKPIGPDQVEAGLKLQSRLAS
ncbi:MAG: hypothetical protein OEU54_13130 [Gemmatimonadota bacterium]|nr:hypothetical protein [Gemmatimonadota bacterium]